VVGYYALASGAVLHEDAPDRVKKGTGQYPIPVVLLTRLGVSSSEQGRGLGKAMVIDALRRVDVAAQEVRVRALLIHAENRSARKFYFNLAEFEVSPTDPLHLLLLMKDLRRAIAPFE
jgi:GNAT superfamily N-acetyltransferase